MNVVRESPKFCRCMRMFCVSRRPSGRLEVVQLMGMMDDMLLKAGVDQQSEELTEISQVRQTDRHTERTQAALCPCG